MFPFAGNDFFIQMLGGYNRVKWDLLQVGVWELLVDRNNFLKYMLYLGRLRFFRVVGWLGKTDSITSLGKLGLELKRSQVIAKTSKLVCDNINFGLNIFCDLLM